MIAEDGDTEPPAPERALHVLVADASPVNRGLLTTVLQRAGHTTSVAENGRKALEAVMREDFDVILMDTQMPVMDGLQATKRVRALEPPKRDIPIIALTADARHGAEQRYHGAGIDGYLSKPLSAKALLETMNALLAEGRQRPSAADQMPTVDHTVIDDLRDFLKPDRLEALLTGTLADLDRRVNRLGACLDAADTDGAAKEAHNLVAVSGNCGAAALSAIARDIDRACRKGLLTEATQDFARIRRIAADATVALTTVRDRLATP